MHDRSGRKAEVYMYKIGKNEEKHNHLIHRIRSYNNEILPGNVLVISENMYGMKIHQLTDYLEP